MKKEEVPQDKGALENITREVVYAKNKDGKFEKALSEGWDVKKEALDNAWEDVNARIEAARKMVIDGHKSPIYYHMEKSLMDLKVLAAYVGFSRFSVKKHMKPAAFAKLSQDKLQKYADTFDLTIDELKNVEK